MREYALNLQTFIKPLYEVLKQNVFRVCLIDLLACLDPSARGGLLPHTLHHVGPLNTYEVPIAHKFTQLTNTEHLTMKLLFVVIQTGLQMKKP
jgi:hypothetical protein